MSTLNLRWGMRSMSGPSKISSLKSAKLLPFFRRVYWLLRKSRLWSALDPVWCTFRLMVWLRSPTTIWWMKTIANWSLTVFITHLKNWQISQLNPHHNSPSKSKQSSAWAWPYSKPADFPLSVKFTTTKITKSTNNYYRLISSHWLKGTALRWSNFWEICFRQIPTGEFPCWKCNAPWIDGTRWKRMGWMRRKIVWWMKAKSRRWKTSVRNCLRMRAMCFRESRSQTKAIKNPASPTSSANKTAHASLSPKTLDPIPRSTQPINSFTNCKKSLNHTKISLK